MSGARCCRPAPGIVWAVDAGQTLLVDGDAGLSWALEGAEAAVWGWLAAGHSQAQVAEMLGALLSLAPADAERRLAAMLHGWLDAGILEEAQ